MYCTGQRLLIPLFILLMGLTVPPLCAQQQVGVSWEHHDWGRFPDRSWQKIRIVTEQLSADGDVISTTTTEKLTQVVRSTRRAVTLRTTSKMEVAGKRFETPPHDFHEGNHGEPIADAVETKDLGATELTVEGRQIPCRIRQYEFTDAEETKVVKIYYSDKVAPFVLKREEVSRSGKSYQLYGLCFPVSKTEVASCQHLLAGGCQKPPRLVNYQRTLAGQEFSRTGGPHRPSRR